MNTTPSTLGEEQHALATREPSDLATVPDARLRPISRGRELAIFFTIYLALVVPAFLFMPVWGTLGVVLGVLAWVIYMTRSYARSVVEQRAVQAALGNDDIEEATRIGQAMMMRRNPSGMAHALAVTVWGAVELRRGRPRETITLLTRALATKRFRGRTGRLTEAWRIEAGLAYAHAILGEVETAEERIAAAEAQMPDNRRGALLTVRVCTLCRKREPEAVIALLDAQWRNAETQLTVGGARTARMFEAFALEQLRSDEYRAGASNRTEKALDRAREARAGAYDYLAVQWSALGDFLRRHKL